MINKEIYWNLRKQIKHAAYVNGSISRSELRQTYLGNSSKHNHTLDLVLKHLVDAKAIKVIEENGIKKYSGYNFLSQLVHNVLS
ncbi:hypothetical protein KY304_00745 [Candidatus Woesearchaeota archaeon]|nr:hypothetical protein [Candidatus Woesearchaeota archaeon]